MGYISQQDLGNKLGKTQSTIANKLRLLNLTDEVQEALMENKISERHARSLLKLNEKNQVIMLNRIINERLTVRRTDEEIEKLLSENSDNGEEKIIENEKEEMTMNNDILKDFNIPTEPIVNEQEPEELVFDNKPQEITLEQVPTMETTVEPIQPLDRVTIEPAVETPVYEQSDVPVYEAPTVEATPAANPFGIEQPVAQPEVTPVVEPVQPEIPTVEPIQEMPAMDQPVESFAQPAPFTLNDDNDFKPVQEMPAQVHHKNFMMDNSFKFDDDGELEVKLPQQEVQAPVDMKQVINKIRECAAEIESYGYKIDTDEVDLENTYEVTFKIVK